MLLTDQVAQTYGMLRFPMTLVWIFAALALLLSAVGIFGVMSYTVSRRTHELAIRMALGADRVMVLRQVLREGLGVTLIGVVIGLAATLGLSRVMANYVYGIQATDPLTYAAAIFVLVLAALAACYVPARRAASVNPMRPCEMNKSDDPGFAKASTGASSPNHLSTRIDPRKLDSAEESAITVRRPGPSCVSLIADSVAHLTNPRTDNAPATPHLSNLFSRVGRIGRQGCHPL